MIENAPNSPRGKGALQQALEAMQEKAPRRHINEVVKDGYGTICYRLDDGTFLTAKGSMKGNIVSVDRELILHPAHRHSQRIIIYLAESGSFYEFDPDEIVGDPATTDNERYDRIMANFSIMLGKRVWKNPPPPQEIPAEAWGEEEVTLG